MSTRASATRARSLSGVSATRQKSPLRIAASAREPPDRRQREFDARSAPVVDAPVQLVERGVAEHGLAPRPVHARVRPIGAEPAANEPLDGFAFVLGLQHEAEIEAVHFGDEPVDEDEQELPFRSEVAVKTADGDARSRRDRVDARRFVSAFGEEVHRRSQQRLALSATAILCWRLR